MPLLSLLNPNLHSEEKSMSYHFVQRSTSQITYHTNSLPHYVDTNINTTTSPHPSPHPSPHTTHHTPHHTPHTTHHTTPQPNNPTSYNLLDDFVNYLNALSRLPCQTSTTSGIRLSATILEVIQGPCSGNQLHFSLNTELVETLNRVNRAKVTNDCIFDDEVEMKKTSIDIFQGLLEGQGSDSVVYDRVLSVIHLDIISSISKGMQTYKPSGNLANSVSFKDDKDKANEMSEAQALLQTECVVLLQMLCNFKPSLYDELGISRRIEDIIGSGTVCIEVIWRGDIHRRFFHVPSICRFLAKSSKDRLVEDVDRSNSENKLIDFLARANDMYREVKHQQLLTEMGISGVFSRESQNKATWITFWLTVIINLCFLVGYELDDDGKPVISPGLNYVTTALNLLQTFVALFTLVDCCADPGELSVNSRGASGRCERCERDHQDRVRYLHSLLRCISYHRAAGCFLRELLRVSASPRHHREEFYYASGVERDSDAVVWAANGLSFASLFGLHLLFFHLLVL
jgi:hypothetical protein